MDPRHAHDSEKSIAKGGDSKHLGHTAFVT
jgi:hypothetical protein